MNFLLFNALALPFAVVPFVWAAGARWRDRTGWLALIAPLGSVLLLLQLALNLPAGDRIVVELPWIPTLGLNLTFVIDGLSLFFGLVVSGVGALVVYYARFYLDNHYAHHGRFYAYLLLFMGAMLGTVFSGNLLLLFVFWELTGVSSFLLIGFLHDKAESRDGARMALVVTSGSALAMLAGVVLLGQIAGTYELQPLLDGALRGRSSPALTLAFILIAVGAFGKSAQFPFQFWLPNAMAAPTPVSAYLHSATMVKLGVFLVARIFPIFRGVDLWEPLLVTLCFGTMLLGALLALLSHDLKAILAYSTVSQLGFLIGYYGMSPSVGSTGDLLHIANHVFYKGCLFMVAGIVDHATGTRDVRRLGGLAGRMPLLLVITCISAGAMAGLPGTLGFVSKEFVLKEQLAYLDTGTPLAWYPIAMLALASAIQVAFALRLVSGIFGGRERAETVADFHAPGFAIQLPPLLLALATVSAGLLPGWFGQCLDRLQTPGLHRPALLDLSLWHGFTPELAVSTGIVAAGLALFLVLRRGAWNRAVILRPLRFDAAFEMLLQGLPTAAKALARVLRFDRQFDFLGIALGFTVLLFGGFGWVHRTELLPALPRWTDFDPMRSFIVLLVGVAVALVLTMRRWTSQLIALSIVGFLITFYYVLFRAPDLAMTQILVETATLLLVLLLLARFPRSSETAEEHHRVSRPRQVWNVALSVAVGGLTTIAALLGMRYKHGAPAGDYYLENSLPLAHGSNVVNTILVDFRGFDTLLEITVLVVACLGSLGLLMRYRRTAEEYEAGEMGPAGYGLGRRKEGKEPSP
jgi:NADH:ubiquinone oxidoreductase subunit 5 (subunit L)/multisubunit Na+/H+ antiporter MnhA subunit/multisubunit Na+/H+ antiporter MnhB subunit